MTDQGMPGTGLIYNGRAIRERGEHLNLTDMWRAAGSDPNKAPANWLRAQPVQEFVAYIAASLKHVPEHLITKARGRNGATHAHWQIGMAYAKALSPEFHAWCNTVVRAHMEGRAEPQVMAGRMLDVLVSRAVAEFDHRIGEIIDAKLAADPRVAALHYLSAKELLDEEKVPSKGRHGLVRSCSAKLRNWCDDHDIRPSRCPRTGTKLFPRATAHEWLRVAGRSVIADWRERQNSSGQQQLFSIKGGKMV